MCYLILIIKIQKQKSCNVRLKDCFMFTLYVFFKANHYIWNIFLMSSFQASERSLLIGTKSKILSPQFPYENFCFIFIFQTSKKHSSAWVFLGLVVLICHENNFKKKWCPKSDCSEACFVGLKFFCDCFNLKYRN